MIGVYALVTVKPEFEQAWEVVAQGLVQDTKTTDEGCVFYDFGKRTETEGEYAFLERWVNKEALDAHLETEHFQRATAEWAQYLIKPIEVRIYEF